MGSREPSGWLWLGTDQGRGFHRSVGVSDLRPGHSRWFWDGAFVLMSNTSLPDFH